MKLIDKAGGVGTYRNAMRNVVTASMDQMSFHAPVKCCILKGQYQLCGKDLHGGRGHGEAGDLPKFSPLLEDRDREKVV